MIRNLYIDLPDIFTSRFKRFGLHYDIIISYFVSGFPLRIIILTLKICIDEVE